MQSPRFYGFDIEIRPRTDLVERYAKPFPEFDESAVKYGNTKDPAKRAELLAAKRAEHEGDRIAYWQTLKDRAALDPFTGEVICVGVISDTGAPEVIAEKTEEATLRQFWNLVGMSTNATSKFVFWSGSGDPSRKFDLDYLVTRSRIRRVELPPRVRSGRYYADRFVDLAGEFLLHQRDRFLSLTKAADMLGLYGADTVLMPKSDQDPVTGANFWQWWDGVAQPITEVSAEAQREAAVRYLKNDVRHLQLLAPIILT